MKRKQVSRVVFTAGLFLFVSACRQDEAAIDSDWQNSSELARCLEMIHPDQPYADIEEITREANRGDAFSAVLLTQAYFRGDIVEHDAAKSIHWLKIASDRGHPLSLYFKAYHLEKGIDGVPRDPDAALGAWKEALDGLLNLEEQNGHTLDAICMIYTSGRAGEPDVELAWKYCQKACEFNIPQPWARRAWFYEEGQGGAMQSFEEAFLCYQKAATLGSALANHHLARCYLSGIGGEKNRELAVGYLFRAALKGVPNARADLDKALKNHLNILSQGDSRVLVKNSNEEKFRFEEGDEIQVNDPSGHGAHWNGQILARKLGKYKVKVKEVIPAESQTVIPPGVHTGQEELHAPNEMIDYVWIPEHCAERRES